MWAIMRANTDDDNNALAMFWLESNFKHITHMLYIYNPTPTPSHCTLLYSTLLYSTLLGPITGYVVGLQARTFTLGLVRAEGPPSVALLAHASVMLGAIAAGLGRAVHTLAHVRCKCTCGRLCTQTQTTIITRSQ